jgi:hypothetical protein
MPEEDRRSFTLGDDPSLQTWLLHHRYLGPRDRTNPIHAGPVEPLFGDEFKPLLRKEAKWLVPVDWRRVLKNLPDPGRKAPFPLVLLQARGLRKL